jgi:putative Mg2+ transporter-C (MgtC) family protein
VPDLATWEILVRLAAAAALGGVIGLERELREREAGFRTHMLVSVGAALFTLVSAYAWGDFAFSQASGVTFDPTRIAAQVVTGIGFIGAGAIIRQGFSVRGLTTAATLWILLGGRDRHGDRARRPGPVASRVAADRREAASSGARG